MYSLVDAYADMLTFTLAYKPSKLQASTPDVDHEMTQ